MQYIDVIVIGAGAAGMMCAIEAGKRNKRVIILEGSNKPGKKILMSGGGRSNFTNINTSADNFISHNRHFCKSALASYKPSNFISLVEQYNIPYHEKKLGQLFCDNSSKDIVNMLLNECKKYSVEIILNSNIKDVSKIIDQKMGNFLVTLDDKAYYCKSLVIASGGLSIPTLGSSPFGYKIAEKFNINVRPTRAGLVPLTLHEKDKEKYSDLSGISTNALVHCRGTKFEENILFTHRGLSGPAILQISSYWSPGDKLKINMLPDINLIDLIKKEKQANSKLLFKNFITKHLPARLVQIFFPGKTLTTNIASLTNVQINKIIDTLEEFTILPNGTEGYRTAEVTLGGVDCDAISSKTMECKTIPGLYFIGEVLDVTGWLGGYNFQWAWSSGWTAGQYV